jgi:hypothetical protein
MYEKVLLGDWKDLAGLNDVHEPSVGKAIIKAFEGQRQRLSEFVNVIESQSSLGRVTLVAELTKRRWLRTSLETVRPFGPVELEIPEDLKAAFASVE